MIQRNIILASASPRRKQLLAQIGIDAVEVLQADIDESPLLNEMPTDCVSRIAHAKASLIGLLNPESIVVAADTIVVCNTQIMGKPTSKEHAFALWQQLSNRTHQVLTCVVVSSNGTSQGLLSTSEVTFCEISAANMQEYWLTKEPCDKAGAYAIQGLAAVWIKAICGSYSGIMGLPLHETALLLKQVGVKTLL